MKKYSIYHTLPDYPPAEQLLVQRQHVIDIEAVDLDSAFVRSQNRFNDDYCMLELRSTTIGDVIVDLDENSTYLVKIDGYELISGDILNYIDWGKNMQLIASSKLLQY